ncbi:MAG: type III pantothenate kinase [Kosmotogaceae bacterium]
MKLLADIGNTNTVFGLGNSSKILEHWSVSTDHFETEDELFILLNNLLESTDFSLDDIESFCVASVVPFLDRVINVFGKKYLNLKPVMVAPDERAGFHCYAKSIEQIGADRIANTIAAVDIYDKNSVVVDLGTATTIDVIENGVFLGGAILPGLRMSMKSLFSGTSKLPQVDLHYVNSQIGRDTPDNIRIGIVNANYFAISGIINEIKKERGISFKVIGSGGFADILNEKNLFDVVDKELTLKGIALYGERVKNVEKNSSG